MRSYEPQARVTWAKALARCERRSDHHFVGIPPLVKMAASAVALAIRVPMKFVGTDAMSPSSELRWPTTHECRPTLEDADLRLAAVDIDDLAAIQPDWQRLSNGCAARITKVTDLGQLLGTLSTLSESSNTDKNMQPRPARGTRGDDAPYAISTRATSPSG
jgi:hypothetical protein